MKTLLIVESPSKAKKLGAMLGADYVVQASGGHIRDLPKKSDGYDLKTLEPIYELTERGSETVKKYLKPRLDGCDKVLLATDPDREGEAIAWHCAEVLKIKNRERVKFHEITEKAILEAIRNTTPLDNNLVRAQEARRIIDRLVGWMVSSPLSRTINEKASAGRVQSPSMGLVVQRERDINSFVKKQTFGAVLSFEGGWNADWISNNCAIRSDAERAAARRDMKVLEFVEKDEFESPPAAFDTAVMQQAASVSLKLDPEETMKLAQSLFEQGLITYHRTDDTNLSDDAFSMIKEYGAKNNLPVVSTKRKFKSAADAQQAHEAIRPTHFDFDASSLSGDEAKLYALILKRAVCSQLDDVVYSVRRVKLNGGTGIDFSDDFVAVGKVVREKGWRSFGVEAENEDEDAVASNPVPMMSIGDQIKAVDGRVKEIWSKPSARYTKASLVKALKTLGIGRPATYAAAVDGLEKKGYVTLDKKRQLIPSELAGKIFDALSGKFSFIDVCYTKQLESDLDSIADGHKPYGEVVRKHYDVIVRELTALGGVAAPRVAAVAAKGADGKAVKCPKCGKGMVKRGSAKGEFYGCSTFPKCKGTMNIPK